MRKSNQWLMAIVTLLTLSVSCKKDQLHVQSGSENSNLIKEHSDKVIVAKTLAKAVAENPNLRTFIKDEALKQFDKDDDILFQFVKDKKINTNTTLFDLLMQYADDKDAFAAACNNSPLLTIFVPTLPNLKPEEWNADTQIPQIAVEPNSEINSGKISIFDAAGKENRISPELIPGFPVLVIKTNERVVLSSDKEASTIPFFSNDKFSFKFLDNVFDGLAGNTDINTRTGTNHPANNDYTIDKANVDAYKLGMEWQRDYVYYGITPTNPNGKYTNKYMEEFASFKLMNAEDLVVLSDDTNDPKPRKVKRNSDPIWTEGRFEFKMIVYINATNGVGPKLEKPFTAGGDDLFNITYERVVLSLYKIATISPRTYYPRPRLFLIPWDLQQYGSAWKFVLYEFDPTVETTKTVTHSSTFSGNFEINLGEILKIGPKFGASTTNQVTTTYEYKFATGSEDLGEGILEFRTPVVSSVRDLSPTLQRYSTHEVTTGMVSFSIEPRAIIQ
jgi:hypothetical protein